MSLSGVITLGYDGLAAVESVATSFASLTHSDGFKIIRPMTINDAALTSSNVSEADYAAYSAATTYAIGDLVIVVASEMHYVYESLQAGNIGNDPLLDSLTTPVYWIRVSYTNRWVMFDGYITSQTSQAEEIDVVVATTGRVDSVALFNIDAATAQIIMTDLIDGVVYDETHSLVSTAGINNWYSYWYDPIVRMQDFSITDLPPYSGASVEVILSDPGETALCGGCIIGLSRFFGFATYGMQIGIQDYSVKTRDAFGNYIITERAFSKYVNAQVIITDAMVDQLQNVLAGYRATPIVYIASAAYKSSQIFGFYKDFSTLISYPTHSICSIQLEGLT